MSYPLISRLQSTLSAATHSRASQARHRISFLLALGVGLTVTARAQTAPTIPNTTLAAEAPEAVAQILLDDQLDADTQGIEASSPTDTLAIVRDKEAHDGLGALRWNYVVEGDNLPQIGRETGGGLGAARSMRFWLKTSQPAAIAVWFESAREAGVDVVPQRLVAHVWSRGGDWQEIELARDRFVLQAAPIAGHAGDTKAENAAPEAVLDPDREWGRVARYGFTDVTNFWLKRTGQARLKGARSLWLDSIQVSTALAANAPIAPPLPPVIEPVAPVDTAPAEFPDNQVPIRRRPLTDRRDETNLGYSPNSDGADPRFQAAPGADEAGFEDEGNEPAPNAAPVDPPIIIAQDALGDGRLWIPVNSQTTDSDKGLEWRLVRLANHNLSLITAVNPQLFTRFPALAIQPEIKGKAFNLAKMGKVDRWTRLVLELSTQQPTRINVAIVERGGATYSMTVPVDQRRGRHRETLPLPRFQLERTSRDTNAQIDLDQIEYLTISDVGAQTGAAGPNLIRINGLRWMH